MMRYQIGEVATLFEMTKGGVRHYEKIGLLHPQRAEGNGYRVYKRDDITDLKRIRGFQAIGFSLAEAHALAQCPSEEALLEALSRKEAQLKRQIALAARTVAMLHDQREQLSMSSASEDVWTVWHRPAMYRIPVWQEQRPGRPLRYEDASARMLRVERSWTAAMPVVRLCDLYYRGEGGVPASEKGSCVLAEDAERFELSIVPELVDFYPERDCLTLYASAPAGGALVKCAEAGIENARARGIAIDENGRLGEILSTTQRGGTRYLGARITLPIKHI